MTGLGLFRRLFIRFAIALLVAMLTMTFLFHLFHKRSINTEWKADLQESNHWLAIHTHRTGYEMWANAWGTTHEKIRVVFFDEEGTVLADSHPDRPPLDSLAIRNGQRPWGRLVAWERTASSDIVIMTRPVVPAFPHGFSWELIIAGIGITGIVILFLFPIARSQARVFAQMTEIARQVASGHFGRTVGIRRNDELGKLIDTFDAMSRKLEEVERLNTRLLHDVSHELRSPLSRIQVMAQTISHRPEERDSCVHGICEEVALLDRLVSDLLQSARFESGAQSLELSSFDVVSWARETFSRTEAKARSVGVNIDVSLPEGAISVEGDPQRLTQAVSNVLDNAIEATRTREGARIDAALQVEGDQYRLVIRDNGDGIPEGDQAHVFRRFYRVGKDRSRDRGGVGLGLSLVRAICEAHQGSVNLDSTPGEGTTLTMTFARRLGKDPASSRGVPT